MIAQFVPKNSFLYPLKINKSQSTIEDELSNFAVEDISTIDKIFIADKQNNTVTLDKVENGWKVNQKFYAREDAIENILQAIGRMKVKRPISKAERNTQIKRLAADGRKVEIYQNGQLTKVYYVGGPTQDQYGTYVILEGSSVPFITHIPGFLGFLTPRFFALEELWRENFIFKSEPKSIQRIQYTNSEDPQKSFTLIKNQNNQYQILDYKNHVLPNIDSLQIQKYVMTFKKISYEAMITEMSDSKKDSIKNTVPFYTIKIDAGENNRQVIKTYHIKNETMYNDDGKLLAYDPDRMYGYFNQDKDLATVQFRTFDRITVPLEFFMKEQ